MGGFVGTVRCNCWREGKTKPLLVSERIEVDELGFVRFPDFDESTVSPEQKAAHVQNERLARDWVQDCCEHRVMFREWWKVANTPGYFGFYNAIEQLGMYPALVKYMPQEDYVTTPPEHAALMLEDLASYLASVPEQKRVLHEYRADDSEADSQPFMGIFAKLPEIDFSIGLGEDGFFIARGGSLEKPFEVLYHAEKFTRTIERLPDNTQTVSIFGEALHFLGYFATTNYQFSGLFHVVSLVEDEILNYVLQPEYSAAYWVTWEDPIRADDKDIATRLQKLCRASVETGNPIFWTD